MMQRRAGRFGKKVQGFSAEDVNYRSLQGLQSIFLDVKPGIRNTNNFQVRALLCAMR